MDIAGLFFKKKKKEEPIVVPQAKQEPKSFIETVIGGDAGEFQGHFKEVMKKHDLPGLDYFEFQKAIEALKDSPLSEEQKYTTVYATFAASGLTVEKIEETSNFYKKKMDEEHANFSNKFGEATKTKVEAPQQEIQKLNEENQRLTEQINRNSQRIVQLSRESTKQKEDLQKKNSFFQTDYRNTKESIDNTIAKLKKYTSGTNA